MALTVRPAWVAGGALVASIAALAPVLAHGAGATGSAAACSERGWAPIAAGRPSRGLAASGTRYAVYHAKGEWHLVVNGAPGATLVGRITADRSVRVPRRPSWIQRSGGALSFRVTSTGHARSATFTARCAKRIAASFQTAAGTPDPVRLGASGQAPTPSFALQRPLATGVSGQVVKARRCPLGGAPECSSMKGQPVPGNVRIDTTPTSRDEPGHPVKTIATDGEGRFSTDLPPGKYDFTPEGQGSAAGPTTVPVEDGVMSDVLLVVEAAVP
jgi:hypothetical protein